jgi:hypothetical protein
LTLIAFSIVLDREAVVLGDDRGRGDDVRDLVHHPRPVRHLSSAHSSTSSIASSATFRALAPPAPVAPASGQVPLQEHMCGRHDGTVADAVLV